MNTAASSTASTPLTVAAQDDIGPLVAQVIANLPVSFAPASGSRPDVVVVSGAGHWSGNAADALSNGARTVIVIDPSADDPDDVESLAQQAESRAAVVALSETFAGNPAIAAFRDRFPSAFTRLAAVFIDSTATDADPMDLALTQIRVLRAVGLSDLTLQTVSTHTRGFTYSGRAGGALLGGVGALTTALPPRLRLRGHSPDRLIEIELPDAASARPADAVLSNDAGGYVLPTIYETAHRATFHRIQAAVLKGLSTAPQLREFASDVRAARAAFGSYQP
jgi:hypothetical protein